MFKYNTLSPTIVPYEAAEKSEKELTLADVAKWVEQWGRHSGRLRFFADRNPTRYFELVAKPLLSIKTKQGPSPLSASPNR
jgi:hypothetical protein